MRGISCPDPLRFNASCCPEKNGQHRRAKGNGPNGTSKKKHNLISEGNVSAPQHRYRTEGVLYIPNGRYNILQRTGRWGYVHRPETTWVREEFAPREAKPQGARASTYTRPFPASSGGGEWAKRALARRKSTGCAQGRLPGTAAMRDSKNTKTSSAFGTMPSTYKNKPS